MGFAIAHHYDPLFVPLGSSRMSAPSAAFRADEPVLNITDPQIIRPQSALIVM